MIATVKTDYCDKNLIIKHYNILSMNAKLTKLIILLSIFIIAINANAQYTYDSVSFESVTSKIILDPVSNHTWQIGKPGKSFFNAPHAGVKAILTDTLNSYPVNDTSRFIYVIRNPYTQTCYTSMEFWHKYDTDTLTDAGIIEASYNGGSSWVVVNDTSNVSPWGSFFWWDEDYHSTDGRYTAHPVITSGKSDGWILSRFNWQWWIPVKSDTIISLPDSLMIRFTFISDPVQSNREGWMIDDILTASAWWQLCSEIPETPARENLRVSPNPFKEQTRFETGNDLADAEINVYNATGYKVRNISHVNGRSVLFTRDHLPPGLYILILSQTNRIIGSTRLIITD